MNDAKTKEQGDFLGFFMYFMYSIQHCCICRPSDSTVPEDAGFEPRASAKLALAAIDALTTRLDLILTRLDLILTRLYLILTRPDIILNKRKSM
jgi:hypothetical protein